jgi:signal transduction histidine kinase
MVLGLALVGVIGLIDLATGPAFGFAFFYFIAVVPIAWTYGQWPGIVVATASAAMWFLADATLSPDQALAAVAWNATSRLAIFVGGAYLIDRVKRDRTRMALIDAQRDDFLRVLEHELTAPAEMMIEGLNAAQARGSLEARDIEAIRHQAESLVFLTRDFVALGQAQAQRLQLKSVPVDIAQLVTEISRQRPDHRSVLVTVPGDGLIVTGDPDRLRQALSNTVSEVFSDAGELDYVSVNVRARGGDALVTVSAATPASTTRLAGSEQMRVSLRLARMLVEAMGGSVTVERAALGSGTRVTIRVPVATTAPGGTSLEAARRAR